MPKLPFDIPEMLRRVESAVAGFPQAALFELADEGYASGFQQLVACILSIRTRDEVMLPTARALFGRADTLARMLELGEEELDERIRPSTFHRS
jgi:endonuclease-3